MVIFANKYLFMADFNLSGTGVALVTPFKNDSQIDFDALRRIIDRQKSGGTDFLVVLGSTGEPATLTAAERQAAVDFVVAEAAGELPVVLGLGGNSTAEVVGRVSRGVPCGVSAVLSVVPYYNKPSQEGIFSHFTAVADASPVPVILYNVPGRTGVNMTASTTLRLASHPNIIGVKEASGNLAQAGDILAAAPAGFSVVSGDDALTLPLMAMGATGVISVIANALPRAYSSMVKAVAARRYDDARRLNLALQRVYRLLSVDGNPSGIKALLSVMGLCDNNLRLPLTPATPATVGEFAALREQLVRLETLPNE